jgi:hypothetical protein
MQLILPENEAGRVKALRSYRILDTPAEERFDDLARLAAYLCVTPIGLIGLVDDIREWFKSRILELREKAILVRLSVQHEKGPQPKTGTRGALSDLWRAATGEKCELSTGLPRTEPHRDRRLVAAD